VPTPRARRILLSVSAGIAALVVVSLVVVNLELFVWPSTDTLQHADAVVVLAGGDGERLDRGLALARDGVAPTLVASTGPNRLCNYEQRFAVICFLPRPNNTRGEVEAIAQLAREHRWRRIVLVTSTYHVMRAQLLLHRCWSGTVEMAPATPHKGVLGWLGAITHEWAGLAEALVERDC
jgi:uncharacterized SAM-binding protein YcdF (DUF218 family)